MAPVAGRWGQDAGRDRDAAQVVFGSAEDGIVDADATLPAPHRRGELARVLREHGRGDLQVHIRVRTPTDLTDEQKKLMRQLAGTFGSNHNTPTENKSFFDKVKDVFSGG